MPEGAAEGTYALHARLAGWHKASGGTGPSLSYETKLDVVDEITSPKPGAGSGKGKRGADEGLHIAVIWRSPNTWEGWHNGVPGSVDEIAAETLAGQLEEYKPLASLGEEKIPTIVLNEEYAPFKTYISNRAKELTEKGVQDTRDRYAVGLRLGLLVLHEDWTKRAKSNQPVDADVELTAKQALGRSVLLMLPAFDALVREAGLSEA